jgi:protease I
MSMAEQSLSGRTVAFLATDGVEQAELTGPRERLERAGATTELISLQAGEIQGFGHLDHGERFPVDRVVQDVEVGGYAALVIPGGVANADLLRGDPGAVAFVTAIAAARRPIAAICHAPWVLIDAHLVRDRRLTSFPTLKLDLRNAGADWVDQEVVVDDGDGFTLITSRNPGDVAAFSDRTIEQVALQPQASGA